MADQIGIITEQNDLGLGFDPISEKDEKIIKKHLEESQETSEAKPLNKYQKCPK